MLKDLVKQARSFRRFDNSYAITDEMIEDIIDTAHLTPSAANRQPIRYYYSNKPETNDLIFPHLAWAGYLEDWEGPTQSERPSAYILLVSEADFLPNLSIDAGIVGQTIQLAATEKGLGVCMIASMNKKLLRKAINLDPKYDIVLTIALGKPVENVVLTNVGSDGSIKYWRDENSTHYVPKRSLKDIIVRL